MKNKVEAKIAALKHNIEQFKNDKKIQQDRFFNDPALISHGISGKYIELGNAYLSVGSITEAKKAFENAKKYNLEYAKNEYPNDKKEQDRMFKSLELYWNDILDKLGKGQLKEGEIKYARV